MTDTATARAEVRDRGSPARWLALPATIAVVAIGVWLTGGVLTNEGTLAKVLTGVWLLLAGVVSVGIAWSQRALAAPVLVGYAIAAVAIGGFLGYTTMVDQVVDEDVVVAAPSGGDGSLDDDSGDTDSVDTDSVETGGSSTSGATENQLLTRGTFVADAHPTEGTASVIETADGVVVTLTNFVTDPGPDLKVYLVSKGADVEDGANLGSLKGNKGDQQYDVPSSIDTASLAGGSVVIWCRAFTVSFGSAALR